MMMNTPSTILRALALSLALLTGTFAPSVCGQQTTRAAEPDHSGVPGVVITHRPASSGVYIGSPGIVVLPNGDYLAKHDEFGPKSHERTHAVTHVYRSQDRGESWEHLAKVDHIFWSTIFVHNDAVYMIGTTATHRHGHCVIRKSTDNGRTWSEARDENTGLLFSDLSYHTAPVPVVIHNGRIWRAMEDEKSGGGWGHMFRAFVMSAPVDADLLKASSWSMSKPLPREERYLQGAMRGWLEGNAVVSPDGGIVDILRVNGEAGTKVVGKAALIEISEDGKTASFDPETGFIDFPGGAKKFTIRFDPESKAYWALTNPVTSPTDRDAGSVRNTLALLYSKDLRNWETASILLELPDVEKHALQYPDWVFDGDDIIAAIRTAFDDGLGGAHRAHDANYLTFHRFKNFRTLAAATDEQDNTNPQANDVPPAAGPATLETSLLTEDPAMLAQDARAKGDAARGAVLFHQPYMSCTKCHAVGDDNRPLGPDLTRFEKPATAEYLVQSLLRPSTVIRQGFETVVIVTNDGKSITGVLEKDTPEAIVLRDPSQEGKPLHVPREEIDESMASPTSLMPTGLVNQLTNRQQFLDLVAYLVEIAEKGPARALELQPPASLIAKLVIPEYESHIDHAGLLSDLNGDSFKRGEAIYTRLCANCHGTHDAPGSMPTSLRFAKGAFKNGADPHSMYQTLTRGFGLMPAQTWMVPQQKYDVIHYIREAYLKKNNPSQYIAADKAYLATLPQGDTRGPEPSNIEPWSLMDYGPSLVHTYEIGTGGKNIAYKGIAVRLDRGPGGISQGRHWMIFDHDTLRMAAAWSGKGFIDWQGIQFNGRHGIHPRVVGSVAAETGNGPGWANPETGSFEDPRIQGRDDKHYGPLPRDWAHYKGLYHHGSQVVISYTVGQAEILESPGYTVHESHPDEPIYARTLNVGQSPHDLVARIAAADGKTAVALSVDRSSGKAAELLTRDGFHLVRIPSDQTPIKLTVYISAGNKNALASVANEAASPFDLTAWTTGGPVSWPGTLQTEVQAGNDEGPFAADVLTEPSKNPWNCQMRLTGLDFFADGNRMAVCSWDGDIWIVEGFETNAPMSQKLTWRRIASGLFQPLGLKILDGKIFVTCRDQIAVLHDLNDDGQIDFYQNFNNDHQVTEHFHEFAMGLQVDEAGNLYYAKSARHALPALVPHHGTLLRVSPDGTRTDIVANGFRAANGVCLNPDGSFFVTDQEGHWTPKNRINRVREGGFYGNMYGYHDVTDTSDEAMEQPLCWITNAFDRSPAELLWVDSENWGPLNGSLLNFSYGYGKVFLVPHEEIGDQMQGGMIELPLPQFPTGIMRGRFHSGDGHLYACGMFAWAGTQQQPGGLYRIRATGKPMHLPKGLHAAKDRLTVEFTEPLDAETASDPTRWAIKVWSLKRTKGYGSKHFDEHALTVSDVELSQDGRTATLVLPDLAPTWCMEVKYNLKSADGESFSGVIHNTIHRLAE